MRKESSSCLPHPLGTTARGRLLSLSVAGCCCCCPCCQKTLCLFLSSLPQGAFPGALSISTRACCWVLTALSPDQGVVEEGKRNRKPTSGSVVLGLAQFASTICLPASSDNCSMHSVLLYGCIHQEQWGASTQALLPGTSTPYICFSKI